MPEEEPGVEFHGFHYSSAAHHQPRTCGKGHRSSLLLETPDGGAICLVCFSNLVSDPSSPSHHVSYALSQLSHAIHGSRGVAFLRDLLTHHGHVLVCPLVQALCSINDEALARQVTDLISDLCCTGSDGVGFSLARDFVNRITDRLSSGAMAWSRRQIYTLHCLGVLLNSCHQLGDLTTCIKDTDALVSNLVVGLELPSEEIRGEILFVLYKLSLLQDMPWDDENNGDYDFSSTGAKLMRLSLEVLLKTQSDDVRLNCIALLTVLAQKGHFEECLTNDHIRSISIEEENSMTEQTTARCPVNLFADAIKGPLLSSDTQVQIGTLDLIFHSFSSEMRTGGQIEVLIEENISDYVFEILRLSENKDTLIVSCLRVLDLLATTEEAFRQRLVIGFPILLSILKYVAEIPLHPVQPHALKLIGLCISNCPGVVSMPQLEELALTLTEIFRRHTIGELGLNSETFILVCSTFVEILELPSSSQLPKVAALIQESSRNAVLSSLSAHKNINVLILHALYLLKEAYRYSHDESSNMNTQNNELANSILEICEAHLLPWLGRIVNDGGEEDNVMGVLETFHFILIQGPEIQSRKFARVLASSSWSSLSFGFLGLFPSERMKWRVYLMLSSVIDGVLGHDCGQPIRDSYLYLPSDPLDLMLLLGQKTELDANLIPAQSAVILILYVSSLYDERLADENLVLASLEKYILLNNDNFSSGIAGSSMLTQLVHLYGLVRGAQPACWTTYSSEAEKLLLHLIIENDWDLLSMGIHPTSLKWLFKQDRIRTPLSKQILNFCRSYSTNKSQLTAHVNNVHIIDVHIIAEMVVSGDNCVTSLLISLLKRRQEGQEEDVISVIDVMQAILNIFPEASNQLCTEGVDYAIHGLYCSHFSTQIFSSCSILVFDVLRSVHAEALSHGEAWLLITLKLLESLIPKLTDETCTQEACLIIGVFCLILHHSTNQALLEASTAILLNSHLVSAIDTIIEAFCAKGPALADHNEETSMGELLIFLLLLYFFTLRSLQSLLQETLDWQDFLKLPNQTQPSSVICIPCLNLCKIIHFGSSSIKLVASECLVELLTRISNQRNKLPDELRCSARYLQSMIAVTEGLIFYEDSTVATNCGLCLSMILGWEKLGLKEKRAIKNSKWCRLVLEELTLSLAAPGLASRSFTNQHKPATHIAVALLKLEQVPGWMKSVFNPSCISGIVDKLSANNVSAEMVELFRELLSSKYLNKEQIAGLQYVFQACRKHMYSERSKENCKGENLEKVIIFPDGIGKMCRLLVHLMLSTNVDCSGTRTKQRRLLEEIEKFFQVSTRE